MKTQLSKPKQIILLCLVLFLGVSCDPEPPKSKDWYEDFSTWRSAVSDAPVKSSFKIPGHAHEMVMCVQRKSGKEYFTGLNVNNGEIRWQTPVPNGDSVAVADAHSFGSHYVFYANDKIRNINLQNGTYTWEVSGFNMLAPDVTGLNEHFYFSAQSKKQPRLGAVFKGNTLTGQIEELLPAPYTDSLAVSNMPGIIGVVRRVDAVNVNGKVMLIVQSAYTNNSNEFWGRHLLGLYDIDAEMWQWNVPLYDIGNMNGDLNAAKYHNGMIFTTAAGNGVCCLDASNAEIRWSNLTDRNLGDIAIINDDMVVIHSTIIRNLNISDGQQNWSASGRNGSKLSKISTFKDFVYLSDDFSGVAFKASNGKPEWNIVLDGPTHSKNNRLKGECVVVPLSSGEDAMIIYTSDLEVYAYKAIM